MARRTHKYRKGGAKRLSTRAKTTKKKLAKIKVAENVLGRKQKKLATAQGKLLKAEVKVNDLMSKVSMVESEVKAANEDVEYYKRQLSYSDLQETE